MTTLTAIPALALRSLRNRKASVTLTVITIAVSVALVIGVERVRVEARSSFAQTITDTDLIVGARSGTLQLLLYSVFRIGQPTLNLAWSSYQKIAASPDVQWSIPISLGDSHRGFRVLGTTHDYFQHYRFGRGASLSLAAGARFERIDEAVLGSRVAARLGYVIGEQVFLSHGIGSTSFSHHRQHPFKVVGILNPTGTPVDQTVHVPLLAIDRIHTEATPAHSNTSKELPAADQPGSITAFFLGLKSPTATLHLQRAINTWPEEALTAVVPGVALAELWTLVRVAEQALLVVTIAVVLAGMFGMLAALLAGLNERRREMAVFRAVGARPWHIGTLLVAESGLLATLGSGLGIGLVWGLLASARPLIASHLNIYVQSTHPGWFDLAVATGVIAMAMLLTLWPARRAYRQSLADGLATRL